MTFPRYGACRRSDGERRDQAPAHWQVKRLRFVVDLNPSKGEVATYPPNTDVSFLPMEAIGEDGSFDLAGTRQLNEVQSGYTYFRDGDVVLAKITPCFENGKGAILSGLENGFGFGTTELIVARPKPSQCTAEFIHWLFVSMPFRKQGEAAMYGAGGQKRVPDAFVRDFMAAIPPLPEQVAITAFLSRETGKIDALVQEQKRLIDLLKEKRQAVISHAVTKGLNPDAPMKDSGVEWLGDVPAHWDFCALRTLVDPKRRITYGIVQPGANDPAGRFMIRGQDYSFGWVPASEIFRVSPEIEEPYRRARLTAGDILFTIVGAGTGNTAIVPEHLNGANITQTTARIANNNKRVSNKFLQLVLSSGVGKKQVALYQKGAAQPGLNLEHLAAFRIPVPPLEEQTSICNFIETSTGRHDALLLDAEWTISLLQERRAALISAAVTGKIDVRGLVTDDTQAPAATPIRETVDA